MPNERQVTLSECVQYIRGAQVSRRIYSVIIHHTWRPTAAQYRGLATVQGVRRYHMQVRGWSDNGYHFMIGPPGDIFRCRPLARAGAHCLGQNQHSVGLAYIANFDEENPAEYRGLQMGQKVVATLLERFELAPDDIYFHRDYADKTCPGTRLDREPYRQQVAALERQRTETLHPCSPAPLSVKVVLLPGSEVINCRPALEDGTTRVDLRPVAKALGCEVYDHITDQNKVYLRRKVRSLADLQGV